MSINSRITPFSPDYSTCSECYAGLIIYPGDFPVDKISEIIKADATKINNVGDRSVNSIGRERIAKISAWFMFSTSFVISKDLRDHVDWVVERLRNSSDGLLYLQGMDSIKMTLQCVWRSRYGHSGPVLWPEQMKAIADLNLECSFDIYFDGPDEDEGELH
jgi:hypothetical protein